MAYWMLQQEEICNVGKCWHHTFIKVIMVTHKHYYFYCNGTGMEYIARKQRNTCSWEMPTLCLHKDKAKR